MPERCKYCGSPLDYCAIGEYCTNIDCGYVDGYVPGTFSSTRVEMGEKETKDE